MKMMKKYIWISLLFLVSCGSRQTNKSYEKEVEQTTEQGTTESETKTTSETNLNSLFNFFESNTNFGIKPIGDLPAKFVFIHNGQKIEVETTGELNFSNQQKTVKEEIKWTKKVQEIFRIKNVYRIYTIHRTITKQKDSKSERSEIAWYILFTVLGIGIGGISLHFLQRLNPFNI